MMSVNSGVTLDDVKRAFRHAVFGAHPDRGGSHELMLRVVAARDALLDAVSAKRLWMQASAKEVATHAALLHANYGYVLTAHKAQGSEWSRVVVVAEPSRWHDARWVYTALTRARETVEVYWPDRVRDSAVSSAQPSSWIDL